MATKNVRGKKREVRGVGSGMNLTSEKNYIEDKDGTLYIPYITPDAKTGMDYWKKVDSLVAGYTLLHKDEIKQQVQDNMSIRNLGNDFGSTKEKDSHFRRAISIPHGLFQVLNEYYPEIFSEKEILHQFQKKYPGFCTVKRI